MNSTTFVLCASIALASQTLADELWPQFLGPNRDGQSKETGLHLDWRQQKPRIIWRFPLGGGYSSQSFHGELLFTQAVRQNRDVVVCLNAETGKLIWWRDVAPVFIDRQRQGAGPRATPTYHDGRIYCLFPRGELVCFSANDGKKLWQTNILAATDAGNHAGLRYYWGMSASPLIEKDLVIVQPGGASNNAVAAFHKDTGKLVWKAGSGTPGYGSPIAIDADGTRQVICSNGRSILSVDPTNGKVLWEYRFGSQYNCNCATPLWVDNKLFLSSAYGVGSTALAVGRGGVREIWKNRNLMNQFATSMIIDGHVYGSHGDFSGLSLRCVELATGKLKWVERRPGKCSLIAAEKHLLCLTERGSLLCIEADPDKYVEKGVMANLLGRKCWAVPALYKKRLYVRDEQQLLCLDLSKP